MVTILSLPSHLYIGFWRHCLKTDVYAHQSWTWVPEATEPEADLKNKSMFLCLESAVMERRMGPAVSATSMRSKKGAILVWCSVSVLLENIVLTSLQSLFALPCRAQSHLDVVCV
jgi:hypothetical protein